MRKLLLLCALFVLGLDSGCANPIQPSQMNLTGNWSGYAEIGLGLETPLTMELIDINGHIEGTGGGNVDCKWYVYCGSFASYTVWGSHNGSQLHLVGHSMYGESWVLTGAIRVGTDLISGTGKGTGVLPMFQNFPWSMKVVTPIF